MSLYTRPPCTNMSSLSFRGAGVLIQPGYTPVYSSLALYGRYGTFRFTMNWIVKSIEQILPRGIIAQTFRPVSVMCSLPSTQEEPRNAAAMLRWWPREHPCPYPNATLEDSSFSLHDLSILESQLHEFPEPVVEIDTRRRVYRPSLFTEIKDRTT